jgi:hypothetical protein
MYGYFPCNLGEKLVDKKQSYQEIKFWDIKEEAESTIVAAQNQEISTNLFKNQIFKKELIINVGFVNNLKILSTT